MRQRDYDEIVGSVRGPPVARKKRDYERIVLFVFAAKTAFQCDILSPGTNTHTHRHRHKDTRSQHHHRHHRTEICMFYLIYFAFHAASHQSVVPPMLLPYKQANRRCSLFIQHHRPPYHASPLPINSRRSRGAS